MRYLHWKIFSFLGEKEAQGRLTLLESQDGNVDHAAPEYEVQERKNDIPKVAPVSHSLQCMQAVSHNGLPAAAATWRSRKLTALSTLRILPALSLHCSPLLCSSRSIPS